MRANTLPGTVMPAIHTACGQALGHRCGDHAAPLAAQALQEVWRKIDREKRLTCEANSASRCSAHACADDGYPHRLWTSLGTSVWRPRCMPCAASVAEVWLKIDQRNRLTSGSFSASHRTVSTPAVDKHADSDVRIALRALPRKARSMFGQKIANRRITRRPATSASTACSSRGASPARLPRSRPSTRPRSPRRHARAATSRRAVPR